MTDVRTVPRPALTGIRIAMIADTAQEMQVLAQELANHGALVTRLSPDPAGWGGETDVDVVLVRVRDEGDQAARRAPWSRRCGMLESLARTDRVIMLLDESLEDVLGDICEFVLAPFRSSELGHRIARLLREPHPSVSMRAGNLELNSANRWVRVGGRPVRLTFHEFEIVKMLMAARGRVMSREEIARRLDGHRRAESGRGIYIHIHRLRAKLSGLRGVTLETVRQVGYRITVDCPRV